MIDLHCHILPLLDDGALDLEDSIAMARQAEADGIAVVCATPHIRDDHDVRIDELAGRVATLNDELAREGIDVEIAQGGEVAEMSLEDLDDDGLREVSLGRNGLWLLLEPRPGPLGRPLVETVETLNGRGFRSIVAHPERHAGAEFAEHLYDLVERGALIQVTAALVADGPAAPTLLQLAQQGLVHLLGSDAHSSRAGRPVRLSSGLSRLREVELLRPHASWIVTTGPERILRGEEIEPPFPPAMWSPP